MNRLLVIFLFSISTLVSARPLDSLRLELKQGKKFIVYRVLKGEKIEDIATKYETEESTLLSMNPLIQTEVKPGQIIKIPLNVDKYGDVTVPEVKPIEYLALPLASFLPPPSQKQLPSKQLMTTTEAVPAEVKMVQNTQVPAALKPKSSEPVILGEPVIVPKKEPETIDTREITENVTKEEQKEPTFGCLKNGTKPTFRQLQTPKTVKQYSSFGKKNDTVRVLIKDKSTYDGIHRDVEKLKKHNMNKIRNFLRTKRLYKVGSTAPDDVLREIYINVSLTGEIENKGSDTMLHNYLHDTIAV